MRLSLTAKQVETAAGGELLRLLEATCANGLLCDAAVSELHEWLLSNRTVGLPAVPFLLPILDSFSLKHEAPDRHALLSAIEKVLPLQIRERVHQDRALLARETHAAAKLAAQVEQGRQRQIREQRRPVTYFNFMVAGVSHDNKGDLVHRYLREDSRVYLARRLHHRHDKNAIAIRLENGFEIGYVPREEASRLAPFLDGGYLHRAICAKILDRGRVPIPVISGNFYNPGAHIEDAVGANQIPEVRDPESTPFVGASIFASANEPEPPSIGYLWWIPIIALLLLAYAVLR